jgi:uncharacterized integral membrane protein
MFLTEHEHLEPPPETTATPVHVPVPSRTKAGSFWIALIVGIVALTGILIFILQNLHKTRVNFVTAHWDIPLGIDLLFAAILGGLIVFVAGATRIVQLRRFARRQNRVLQQRQSQPDRLPSNSE